MILQYATIQYELLAIRMTRVRIVGFLGLCSSTSCIIIGISAIFHPNLRAYGLWFFKSYVVATFILFEDLNLLTSSKIIIKNKIKYKLNTTKTTLFISPEQKTNKSKVSPSEIYLGKTQFFS